MVTINLLKTSGGVIIAATIRIMTNAYYDFFRKAGVTNSYLDVHKLQPAIPKTLQPKVLLLVTDI